MKGENHIAPMDFAEYPRKSDISENSKGYYGQFLRKAIVMLVKVDETHNIKKSRQWLLVES